MQFLLDQFEHIYLRKNMLPQHFEHVLTFPFHTVHYATDRLAKYCFSKKSCPIFIVYVLYKNGPDFLDN